MTAPYKKTPKPFYRFGVITIILVLSMLCMTAISALSMLTAYSNYKQTVQYSEQIKAYYESEKEGY